MGCTASTTNIESFRSVVKNSFIKAFISCEEDLENFLDLCTVQTFSSISSHAEIEMVS